MTFRVSGLLLSIVALAGVAGTAFADDMMVKHKHKPKLMHVSAKPASQPALYGDVALPAGSIKDPGSDNRYFSDTVTPGYTLGPTIFGRWK